MSEQPSAPSSPAPADQNPPRAQPSGSLHLGRMFGIPIRVHWTFPLLLLWLAFSFWGDGLGVLVAVALVAVGLFAVVADLLADAVSARVGGASWQTTALAGAVGFALLFVTGPLGILVGVVGTVFALEYWETEDHHHAARAAATTSLGILASAVVQVLLTLSMLLGFGLFVFVW